MKVCHFISDGVAQIMRNASFVIGFAVIFGGSVGVIQAQSITLSTTADEINGNTANIGALIGSPGGAGISLREAITATNNEPVGANVTINIPAGNYAITIAGPGENNGATGDFDLNTTVAAGTKTVTITGAGSATTTLTGISGDRILDVHPVNNMGDITVNISGIKFTLGNSTGGGGAILAGRAGDITNITNCIFENNTASASGGAISQSSSLTDHDLTITNSTFTGNNASTAAGAAVNYNGIGNASITGCTFTNNTAGTQGGAINISGGGTGPVTTNIFRNNFLNNTANGTQFGGAVLASTNAIAININFNRFVGNTSPNLNTGSGPNFGDGRVVTASGGTIGTFNADNNWWGVNTGPVTTVNSRSLFVAAAAGWLQLRNTPASATIVTGQTTTISADILGLSTGGSTAAGNLTGLATFPSVSSTIFSLPVRGTLSATNGQFVNGVANLTPTFTANAVGAGSTSATADSQTIAGAITINKANTTASITNNPATTVVGQGYTVNFSLAVNAPGSAAPTAPTGNVQVSDGSQTCSGAINAGGTGSCSLTSTTAGNKTLTATYQGDTNFNASPASAGVAHTVNKADTTASISADTPDPSNVGQSVTVTYSVAVTAPGVGTPTGNVVVSDGTTICTGTVAAGQCTGPMNTTGNRNITATYQGDTNFNASPASANAPHMVGEVTWTGASSTAFAANGNWNTGLAPGSGDTAIIPTGATNQPTISGATSVSSLSVASGRTLTVNSTLTVSGALTNNGTIGGTGTIVNNFSNGGILAPGLSPGILNITGTFANPGSLNIEIGGIGGAGVNPNGHDQLLISGAATLGGTLNVALTNGFTPAPGASFLILDAASSTGTFTTVNLPNILPNAWSQVYNNAAGTFTLTVVAPTAANVTVGGRVLTSGGRAVSKARLTLTDGNGNTVETMTNPFGYYRFQNVSAGQVYVIAVRSKRYRFTPRTIVVDDELTEVDFIADP